MKKQILLSCLLVLLWLAGISQSHKLEIQTNYGNITIMLYDSTPVHRDNFMKLVKEHYYDSLLFHRIINGFVAQAGDPYSKYAQDTVLLGDSDLHYTLKAEIMPDKYYHKRGAVGMARDENPEKASSACQFYIVQGKLANDSIMAKARIRTNGYETPKAHEKVYRTKGGIPHLDSRYTVFGEVLKGMDVIDRIAKLKTDKHDRPVDEVRIKTVRIIK